MKLAQYRYRLYKLNYQLHNSLVRRGVIGTFATVVEKAFGTTNDEKPFTMVHPFDEEFGVDTSGLLRPEEIFSGKHSYNPCNTGYFATAPSIFEEICERLEINVRNFTFVDLGSGKGRILLLASNFPFRKILGIEILPELHQAALRNIELYHPPLRQCAAVEAVRGDAAEFEFPSGPLVVFMWNPFIGTIFTKVLSNLESSLTREPREVYVLYVQPDMSYLLDASPLLRKLWVSEVGMTEEDYAAHAFSSRMMVCAAYRSVAGTEGSF